MNIIYDDGKYLLKEVLLYSVSVLILLSLCLDLDKILTWGFALLHICVDCWKKVSLVAESKAEINLIFSRTVIIYAFWGLIGF